MWSNVIKVASEIGFDIVVILMQISSMRCGLTLYFCNINADKLYEVWSNVIKVASEIGFDIVVILMQISSMRCGLTL